MLYFDVVTYVETLDSLTVRSVRRSSVQLKTLDWRHRHGSALSPLTTIAIASLSRMTKKGFGQIIFSHMVKTKLLVT